MTTSVLNIEIVEVENKILTVVTTTTVPDLVKKTDYEVNISDIEGKYFSASDYNKFTSNVIDENIKQTELVNSQ